MRTSGQRLIKNIIDQIQESQIKLGYVKETIRLYYPVSSLNNLLDSEVKTTEEMVQRLTQEFSRTTPLGDLKFSQHQGRIEISIPPEGGAYVHDQIKVPDFLQEIISFFQINHSSTIEEICRVFEKYNKDYVCMQMPESADFDYVIYFEHTSIDEYYYCIKMEMGHTISHRFLKADYEQLITEAAL